MIRLPEEVLPGHRRRRSDELQETHFLNSRERQVNQGGGLVPLTVREEVSWRGVLNLTK